MTAAQPKLPTTTKDQDIDNIILTITKHNPHISTRQVGIKLKELGIYDHEISIYKRLNNKDRLKETIESIKRDNEEYKHRELVPLAHDILTKSLKTRTMTLKDKAPIALQIDRSSKPDQVVPKIGTVNIAMLQQQSDSLKQVLDNTINVIPEAIEQDNTWHSNQNYYQYEPRV